MNVLLTILLLTFSARLTSLPIAQNPVYLSHSGPRAERVIPVEKMVTPPVKEDILSLGPRLSAESAIVVDKESGAVLFEKNSRQRHAIASITKLMTALVFFESNPDLEARVKMTEDENREGGDEFIKPGEEASLRDYLVASLLGSANNATIVLSRSANMDAEAFINRMNQKARELGMYDTWFEEPTGLSPNDTSTARDITRLLNEAAKNDAIKSITGTNISTVRVYPRGIRRTVLTTNHLLGTIVFVEFGKTGYLDESLYNLAVSVATRPGHELYIVTFGSKSNEERVQDAKSLAVWAEKTYSWE